MNSATSDLAAQLIKTAKARSVTLGTAESCTGGGIGQAITGVSGASEIFLGGIIAYANAVKTQVLGVPQDMLLKYGAVSSHVAASMAQGACNGIGCDYSVAVTGIAGPGGGSAEKPVGLVYISVASATQELAHKQLLLGSVGREIVRQNTIDAAIVLLKAAIIQT